MVDWLDKLLDLIPVVALVITLITFTRANNKENKQEGASLATIQSDIGYIKACNDDIKHQLNTLNSDISGLRERVSKVELAIDIYHKKDGHTDAH